MLSRFLVDDNLILEKYVTYAEPFLVDDNLILEKYVTGLWV